MAVPGSRVLFLVVELCALTFRKDDISKSNIVATALFGDGAAGAILSTDGDGPAFGPGGEYTWPNSLDIMGWEVEEDGLKARFAQSIPALVASDFKTILHAYLQKNDLKLKDIDGFRLSSRRRQGARRPGRCLRHRARRADRKPQRPARLRQHVRRHRPVRAGTDGLARYGAAHIDDGARAGFLGRLSDDRRA